MALEAFLQSDTESKVLNLIRENSKIGNSELRLLFKFVINPKRTVKLGSDSREVSFVEIAFKHCNVEALKMLLCEFGANPNICRGYINLTTNVSFIDSLAKMPNPKVIECFLELGVDVNVLTEKGRPLHFLCRNDVQIGNHRQWMLLVAKVFILAVKGARYDLTDGIHAQNTPKNLLVQDFALCKFDDKHQWSTFQKLCLLIAIGEDSTFDEPQPHHGFAGMFPSRIFEEHLVMYFYFFKNSRYLCELIMQSGYRLKHLDEIAAKSLHSAHQVSIFRRFFNREPLSLQRLAGNVVRTSLRPNAVAALKQMPFTSALKNFITFDLAHPSFFK